jgi:hypothetical protein
MAWPKESHQTGHCSRMGLSVPRAMDSTQVLVLTVARHWPVIWGYDARYTSHALVVPTAGTLLTDGQ